MDKEVSILFVPFGTVRVAATRYRIYQYLPYLDEQKIKYKVFSILSDSTTKQMVMSPTFDRFRKLLYYLQLVLERIIRFCPVLILAARYKVVFIQRASFPFGLEKVLQMVNKNIIFDLDDAIFISDRTEKGFVNRIKELSKTQEVADILKVSKGAIVENEYVKDYARKYCREVFLIPGPIDTKRNFVKEKINNSEVSIGWIGSPSTTVFLKMLHGVFKELGKKYKIQVKLIGAGQYKVDGVRVVDVNWCLNKEVEELQSFDIGVMPMPNNEWTKGKLGCKMLQYMSVGVPAVVSYTPTNAEAIENGINGFLVNSEEEWIEKLSLLIENPDIRRRIGMAGRRTAEEKFSVRVNAPRILSVLRKFAQGN
jgi:glycosyltransferase involved in cell wall biosynthesis